MSATDAVTRFVWPVSGLIVNSVPKLFGFVSILHHIYHEMWTTTKYLDKKNKPNKIMTIFRAVRRLTSTVESLRCTRYSVRGKNETLLCFRIRFLFWSKTTDKKGGKNGFINSACRNTKSFCHMTSLFGPAFPLDLSGGFGCNQFSQLP